MAKDGRGSHHSVLAAAILVAAVLALGLCGVSLYYQFFHSVYDTVITMRSFSLKDASDFDCYVAEFSFSNVSGLSPTEGLCLVLEFVSADHHSCKVRFQDKNAILPSAAFLQTEDAGSTWNPYTDQALLFYVYGTVTTPGEPTTVDVSYVTGVRVSIRVDQDTAYTVDTGVQTANAPEVIDP